ncbi:hypothetical protein [Pelagibacterium halotolerans]|uniref:hypothetical protein n=1 Tax=Pelagibacterium halotolerans TaxID=531813 RepID=UPI00384E3595
MRLVLFVYQPSGSWDIQRRHFRLSGALGDIASRGLGDDILVCERQAQTLSYFAIGRLCGHLVSGQESAEHVLCVSDLAYFKRPVAVENTAGSIVVEPDIAGGNDCERIGWISESEFRRLAQAGGLPPNAAEARAMLEQGFGEHQQALWHEEYSGIIARGEDDALEERVLTAYDHTCAVSGLKIRDRQGARCEAVAVPIGAGSATEKKTERISDMICLNQTWAFLYNAGLMAIAGDYSIFVKDALIPEAVLSQLPPSGKIRLPANPDDWPDPDALASHCGTYFG